MCISDELEYCTSGKVLIIGCEDGMVYLIDIASRNVISCIALQSGVMDVCWISSTVAIAGLSDGKLVKIDIKVRKSKFS